MTPQDTRANLIAQAQTAYVEGKAAAAQGDYYAELNQAAFAARLKQLGAPLLEEAAASTPPTPPANAGIRKADVGAVDSREAALGRIAAGSLYPLPHDMLQSAVADGISADAFAVAVADYMVSCRAAGAREAEINKVAGEIARFIPERNKQ